MADDDDMDAEMEKRIFDMQDIDKMENFVDNQVLKGVKIPIQEKAENKTKSKKEYSDKIKNVEKKMEIESKISKFEKKMKKDDIDYDKNLRNDSDYEEDFLNDDIDTFTDKALIVNRYTLIQKKLKEKNNQIEILRNQLENIKGKQNNILDSIKNSKSSDLKDKKLIDLVKKNQDLSLKIERHKLKESNLTKQLNETEKKLNEVKNEMENLEKNKNIPVDKLELNSLKKNLKQSESHLSDIRNKLQLTKEENIKLNILLKREVGDSFDLNRALTDKNYFKPRAEIIEGLKAKIKQLEKIIQVNNLQANPNNSLNSSNTINNNNGLNLPLIPTSANMIPYSQYKKEREELQNKIEKAKKDMNQLTEQNNKLKSRRNVLEKELKSQKEQLTDKIKILIEKSDNDEKLITALKNELLKKGINVGNFYENETFNLKQEISKLRDQLKQKEKYINEMNTMFIPSSGNKLQKKEFNSQSSSPNPKIDDATLTAVMNRLAELEKENKELKTLGGGGEDSKIVESLARENAKLRKKIADLEDRLANK